MVSLSSSSSLSWELNRSLAVVVVAAAHLYDFSICKWWNGDKMLFNSTSAASYSGILCTEMFRMESFESLLWVKNNKNDNDNVTEMEDV